MLTLRRSCSSDQNAVWELHHLALIQAGTLISNEPWDDDLHQIDAVYLNADTFVVRLIDA
ncbi:MAG: hypothetical protein HGA19_05105 [Oscillochloris sp.]|nr:hypothetical protein [Oscillochloris sp.]